MEQQIERIKTQDRQKMTALNHIKNSTRPTKKL